jgi:putative flippase GtrA
MPIVLLRRVRASDRLPPRLVNLARYASVSVVSTTVGLSTLAVLVGIGHWPAGWANVAATGLGTVPSFELNRRWVWHRHDRRSWRREVLPFAALCSVELVASTAAVHAASQWTGHAGWGDGTRTVVDLGANVTAYGVLWVAQYIILDRLLFARPGMAAPTDPRIATTTGPADPTTTGPVDPTTTPPSDVPCGDGLQPTLCARSAAVEVAASGWLR